jgi:hypothetical protein
MLVETRLTLIKNAAESAKVIDSALTKMLDAYDTFQISEKESQRAHVEYREIQVSIDELNTLPFKLANRIDDWARDRTPVCSYDGFQEHVINELSLHMTALLQFLTNRKIECEIDPEQIGHSFMQLASANRLLA